MKGASRKRARKPAASTNHRAARAVSRLAVASGLADASAERERWRSFIGEWLTATGCTVGEAARGDWEVTLSSDLGRRWRRQRVRLVFDPQRPTLPRGAWFAAPGSTAGRKILEASRLEPVLTRRTALPQVPGAPENGLAAVCKVRGLTWGVPRLGPVRYERRIAFHAMVTIWGGLPAQESWVILVGADGGRIEWERGQELPEVRSREGLYQIGPLEDDDERQRWTSAAQEHIAGLLDHEEREWEKRIERLRDDELRRLSSFYAARVEEEEERSRRRSKVSEESEMDQGDATSLKLEWERRAVEVQQRWALRTEVRLWGLVEWAWPVAELEQEVRAGAVHVKLVSPVDVARGRPALPRCPRCDTPAEILVRSRNHVACAHCAT